MNEKIFEMYQDRIAEFIASADSDIYPKSIPLTAQFALSNKPVPYNDRMTLQYQIIGEGEIWGHEWQSAWFRLNCVVPEDFAANELCLRIHTGGEALLFDEEGTPIYGLTGFTVYDTDYYKDRYYIGRRQSGECLEFWLEAAANGLFGIMLPQKHELKTCHPQGKFDAIVQRLQLCVFDREVWNLVLDFKVLFSQLKVLGRNDYRGMRLLYTLNQALDIYNYVPANAETVRTFLKEKAFSRNAASSALHVVSIGHAHIDVGWLWPVNESIRKAARTFSSQLALMEKYPKYTFGASQAELYLMMKENYPALYEKIKDRVKEGRWEIQGGMWVETDCNLISGESMVRQFLYGKHFFNDEFGVEVRNLWLPDVFGYSAAMPQIIRRSGCDYFLTQKMSWNKINAFPHNTFRWRGIDGSEVITHFPPEDTYIAAATPEQRINGQNNFRENGYLDEFISLIGIGNGGGGASEEFVEREMRMRDLDGCPQTSFGRADAFFDRLAVHRDELPCWDGELYFETHRGTLTTQSRTKRGNRLCEQALTALEFFASMLPPEQYPTEMLKKSWRTLLRNQFHDIIPGTSIGLVYERTEKEHTEILRDVEIEMKRAASQLLSPESGSCVLINSLSYAWNGLIALPESWGQCGAADLNGNILPTQSLEGRIWARVALNPGSFTTLTKVAAAPCTVMELSEPILENDLIRYEFSLDGKLVSAFDKEEQRELLTTPANSLLLYHDRPLGKYDAWDLEIFYKHDLIAPLKGQWLSGNCGAACSSLEFIFKSDISTLNQKVILRPDSKRLDFITRADWRETHKILRVEFPVKILSDTASFDIQYGTVKRNVCDNTSWDIAKFEVCGQRYADYSDNNYGIALLNDCKYGYNIRNSVLGLTLLRSTKYPDFNADQGEHTFTYAFMPHCGTLIESTVQQDAACLNRMPWCAVGFAADRQLTPPCHVEGMGVTLEVIKKAEKSNARIIRIVENQGKHTTARLLIHRTEAKLCETDLVEFHPGKEIPVHDGQAEIALIPFEIKTLRLSYGQ